MPALNRSKTFGDTKPSELLGLHGANNGFVEDLRIYIGALLRTPQNFIARAIHVHNFAETVQNLNDARKGEMVKPSTGAHSKCGRSTSTGVGGGVICQNPFALGFCQLPNHQVRTAMNIFA